MNFTSREEYGLLAVMHLAANVGAGPVQAREIARIESIPEQFLDQVLASLRRAGIIRSIRGAAGGYELARPARILTAGDVLRALSGSIMPIQCLESETDRCTRLDECVVVDLWKRVQTAVSQILDTTTIQDMLDERARRRQESFLMMNI